MPNVVANNIKIEYDTFGDSGGRPLVLIMGLATQMIAWQEEFCELLVKRGHYVIRFDNRDVGLSEKFDSAGVPNVIKIMKAMARGEAVSAPYSIDDMADDTVGLLDVLGIDSAHVCGASMGGMIAQTMAYRHPSRVKSMVSIMSSSGDPSLPQPRPEAMTAIMTPPPSEREAFVEHMIKMWKIIAGSGFELDLELIRGMVECSFDRCFHPQGAMRQLAAIMAHGSRKPGLAKIKVPALVIHGGDDPLVPVEAGRDTAAAIPGAELLIIEGMGHYLPPQAWPEIVDAIAALTEKAS